jgi:hypothetical protein
LAGLVSRRILESTPRFTWDDWVRVAFDNYVIGADSLLPRCCAISGPIPRAMPAGSRDRYPGAVESAQRYGFSRDDSL